MASDRWKWFGDPGHLIVAQWCQFHLCTKVGKYLVSTVGKYLPPEGSWDIHARSKNVILEGRGDARRADYMRKIGYETIGYDRLYETMVFKAGTPCKSKDCGCGLPEISGSELDFLGYNSAKDATAGHMKLCRKWSKK